VIVLGEAVDGIARPENTVALYSTIVLAYLVVLSLKLLYFNIQIAPEENHVMHRKGHHDVVSDDPQHPDGQRIERIFAPSLSAAAWVSMHQFLIALIALVGDALAMIAKDASDTQTHASDTKHAEFEYADAQPENMVLLEGTMSLRVQDRLHPSSVRALLCSSVAASVWLIGFLWACHHHEAADNPKHPLNYAQNVLRYIGYMSWVTGGAIILLMQYLGHEELDDIGLLSVIVGISFFVIMLGYLDEMLMYKTDRVEHIHSLEKEIEKIQKEADVNNVEIPIEGIVNALDVLQGPVIEQLKSVLRSKQQAGAGSLQMDKLLAAIAELPVNCKADAGTRCFRK